MNVVLMYVVRIDSKHLGKRHTVYAEHSWSCRVEATATPIA